MENELLCKAMEERILRMPAGEEELFREAVRRLRISGGRAADRIVETAAKLTQMTELVRRLIDENDALKRHIEENKREVTLHLHYDLEEEGCGAVLQEGQNKYYVSVLQLAEMLTARRDGRLVILPKEENE